jgi:hypothetical protein
MSIKKTYPPLRICGHRRIHPDVLCRHFGGHGIEAVQRAPDHHDNGKAAQAHNDHDRKAEASLDDYDGQADNDHDGKAEGSASHDDDGEEARDHYDHCEAGNWN